MKVEIDCDVLKNLYNALHWYVSHECDYRMVTPKLLSDMDKVATVLSECNYSTKLINEYIKDTSRFGVKWSSDGEFLRVKKYWY